MNDLQYSKPNIIDNQKEETTADHHSVEINTAQTNIKPKVLGTMKLTGILFISVVGGAYGAEPLVQSVGPLVSTIIMICSSLLVMLPICLITAELSSCLPSNGGLVDWVTSSMSPYSNFFTMFITIISLIGATIDNAVYPTLFIGYLTEKVPNLEQWAIVLIKFGVTSVATVLNVIGVDIIGKVSVLFTLFVLSPFVIFCCVGVFDSNAHWDNLIETLPFKEMNWSLLISVLFWNINGVDGCGNISEEVKNVEKTVPRSMFLLVIMTVLTYIIPCSVGTILDDNWAKWQEGSFVSISEKISIGWIAKSLPWLMFIGGLISSLGYLLTLLCTASRLFHGFIQLDFHKLITKYVGHVNKKFNTPDVSIILQGVLIFILSASMNFDELVGVDSAFYAIRVLFICIAYILLRYRYPNLHRPYKFGCNLTLAVLYATPTIIFCAACCILGLLSSTLTVILGGVLLNIVMISSVIFYWFYPHEFKLHENLIVHMKGTVSGYADEITKIKEENRKSGTVAIMDSSASYSMTTESDSNNSSYQEQLSMSSDSMK
ncbi:amino acid-polyamine transporter, putative [Entamoeba histolytica HM-1:IMSS-B]|uniref:Amino acid-polyamine transporter, putative n=6 Tax=Entamoeba histolytica TaxID=5759 RepID=C4M0U9_ENTH1|nr:amino acid-polyamine transporter, putative [Entamoeba histolytica HM-1:IMSS]EMD47359.1 amino acidpolyamine transporter, putative [Entamoeba histolytica KU27]EMH75083.1 amino acid-polyamine transporter, putative [Entamoeba histolytica HM-1:IMSS-B]EMS13285.1 amino acid-polyamine transporter, putative [Entamoeba histolytica HM-3:IMSS]ENY63224.1 amino acid-polyamine transporter, putative [Entamoeba histolytica HM-1:IMSS-A]GAT94790.1 amino acid-polyamine transporter putative [Entamoeba histolyti|eukprot:XP_651707.1 amino acid-polyamine transporter, putative [Entamoeba histolytica HM-1:IMSS]